jgi:hypothetical protein
MFLKINLASSVYYKEHTQTNLKSTKYREDVMRALIITIAGIIAPATAMAASGLSEDNSGIFVWVFLGFCALIVVAQVIPAVLLMTGMVKGAVSVMKDEKVEAPAKN